MTVVLEYIRKKLGWSPNASIPNTQYTHKKR
jgi:hypothetical protein